MRRLVFKLPLTVAHMSWDRSLIYEGDEMIGAVVRSDDEETEAFPDPFEEVKEHRAEDLAHAANSFHALVSALEPFLELGFDTEQLRRRVDPGTFRDIVAARAVYDRAMRPRTEP